MLTATIRASFDSSGNLTRYPYGGRLGRVTILATPACYDKAGEGVGSSGNGVPRLMGRAQGKPSTMDL